MTQDEIIEMARESGAMFEHINFVERDLFPVFARFAKLVAEREREQCALICDAEWGTSDEQAAGVMFSKEIRARGKK